MTACAWCFHPFYIRELSRTRPACGSQQGPRLVSIPSTSGNCLGLATIQIEEVIGDKAFPSLLHQGTVSDGNSHYSFVSTMEFPSLLHQGTVSDWHERRSSNSGQTVSIPSTSGNCLGQAPGHASSTEATTKFPSLLHQGTVSDNESLPLSPPLFRFPSLLHQGTVSDRARHLTSPCRRFHPFYIRELSRTGSVPRIWIGPPSFHPFYIRELSRTLYPHAKQRGNRVSIPSTSGNCLGHPQRDPGS